VDGAQVTIVSGGCSAISWRVASVTFTREAGLDAIDPGGEDGAARRLRAGGFRAGPARW
jgi:hypothetical protein